MKHSYDETKQGFLEIRKIFPLLAGLLIFSSIFLPIWRVSMTAPQYPEKELTIWVYANRMQGDIWEVNTLNQYAGVKFPEKMPEFKFLPALLGVLGSICIASSFASKKAKRWLLPTVLVILLLFNAAALADLQWKLYQIGHNLDPHAPMQGVQPFLPPLLGSNQIANFTTFAMFGLGGFSMTAALVLSALAAWKSRSADTVAHWGHKIKMAWDD